MFHTLSWHEFIQLAVVAVIAYYAVATVLFYRAELVALVKGKSGGGAGLSEVEQHDDPTDSTVNPIGQAKTEDGVEHVVSVPADQLRFWPEEADQRSTEQGQRAPHAEVSELSAITGLLGEVKTLVQVIAECNGSPEEAAPMLQSLLSRHGHLSKTNFREAVTLYLYSTCKQALGFKFSLDQIEAWWGDRERETNKQIIHP